MRICTCDIPLESPLVSLWNYFISTDTLICM
ncbi:rCG30105 [Rattus norvegicus]|uniref:RCG30105 n=1 Tax=Rattus norvegicus TaxID=10116 RepID=A6IMY3_RAT|nr:rCG30105 [Rattus norvegicus]